MPDHDPEIQVERCILHIGPPKTGTTSIQQSLHASAAALADAGILYPTCMANHLFFVSWFSPTPENMGIHRRARRSPAQIAQFNAESRADFEAELTRVAPHTLLISSEFLTAMAGDGHGELAAYLGKFARRIEVLGYARRPSLHSQSMIAHRIRRGDGQLAQIADGLGSALGRSVMRSVEKWVAVLGREAVHIRPFPGDPPRNGDVLADFLGFAGIDPGIVRPLRANPALSGPAVMLADALNRTKPRFGPARMDMGVLDAVKGPGFRLPHDVLAAIDEGQGDVLAYWRDIWGIEFPELGPAGPAVGGPDMFTPETVESLAQLINDLAVDLRRARKELRQLTAGRGRKTD